MPRRVDELFFDLTANTTGLTTGMGRAQKTMGGFATFMKGPGGPISALVAFGVAAIAAGAKATAMAATLDKALREVSTLLPRTVGQLEAVREEIIKLSTEVPEAPELLSKGLYQTISAGISDTAEALGVLRVAGKAATAGLSDTFTAVDAITTVLNAYQMSASEATAVSDVFFATIREGKLQFGDIASNIGNVATSAALAGVSIEEVGAALATMTKFGINAAEASTAINRFLLSLTQSTDDQVEAAARMGIEWSTTELKAKGLVGFLQQMQEATKGNIDLLAEINPNIRAARAAFILAGKGAAEYGRILKETQTAQGASQSAFEKMKGSLDNQAALLKNSVNAAWLELGSTILPHVANVLRGINRLLEKDGQELARLYRSIGDEQRAVAIEQAEYLENVDARLAKSRDNILRTIKQTNEGMRLWESRTPLAGTRRGGPLGTLAQEVSKTELQQLAPVLADAETLEDAEKLLTFATEYGERMLDAGNLTETAHLQLLRLVSGQQALAAGIRDQLKDEADAAASREPPDAELAALEERVEILRKGGEYTKDETKELDNQIQRREIILALIVAQADLQAALANAYIPDIASGQKLIATLARQEAEAAGLTKDQYTKARLAVEVSVNAWQRIVDLGKAYIGVGQEIGKTTEKNTDAAEKLAAAWEKYRAAGLKIEGSFKGGADAVDIMTASINAMVGRLNNALNLLDDLKDGTLKLGKPGEGFTQGTPGQALATGSFQDFLGDVGQKDIENARRAIEKITSTTDKFGIKVLAIGAALKEWGVSAEDLGEEFEARVAPFLEDADDETDDIEKTLSQWAADISLGARSAISFANALGIVDDSAVQVLNNILLIGEGIARFASGDIIGGTAGVLGGVAGFFGESEADKKRREVIAANTNAVARLTESIDAQAAAFEAISAADRESFDRTMETVGDSFIWNRGDTNEAFFRDQDWVDNLDAIIRAGEALGIPLDFSSVGLFIEGLKAIEEALAAISFEDILKTLDGFIRLGLLALDVRDIEATEDEPFLRANAELQIVTDAVIQELLNFPNIMRGISDPLVAGANALVQNVKDAETPEERAAAAEALQRYLLDNLPELEAAGYFGDLTTPEIENLIRTIDNATDTWQDIEESLADQGEKDDTDIRDEFDTISQANTLTREQSDVLIALMGTSVFWLQEIAENTKLLSVIPVTEGQLAAAGGGTTIIEGIDIDISVTGSGDPEEVGEQVFQVFDKRLGTAIYKGYGGTPPRRNF